MAFQVRLSIITRDCVYWATWHVKKFQVFSHSGSRDSRHSCRSNQAMWFRRVSKYTHASSTRLHFNRDVMWMRKKCEHTPAPPYISSSFDGSGSTYKPCAYARPLRCSVRLPENHPAVLKQTQQENGTCVPYYPLTAIIWSVSPI